MKFIGLILGFALASVSAHAVSIVVVTDQPLAAKAKEISALFQVTAPFSQMKSLKFKVIQTTTKKLGCQSALSSAADLFATTALEANSENLLQQSEWRDRHSELSHGIETQSLPPSCSDKGGLPSRLITCDSAQSASFLSALKKSEGAAFVIVVKDDTRYGGYGGPHPVVTSGSPAAMAIHELMHRLGFADEYGYYNACEADIYCPLQSDPSIGKSGYGSLPMTSYNVSVFTERSKYASNSDVRKVHAKDLPWLTSIDAATDLVTRGKLGTPVTGKIGVYRAIVCDNASKPTETWQSTSQPTIMKTLGTTYIPKNYWAIIAKSLGTTITP